MTTVHDVPPEALIANVAEKLKKVDAVKSPPWAAHVKTGIHTEKAPSQPDWWHTRAAAVLRKVYTIGPIGTERLRAEFGGYRDRGVRPNRAKSGSGSVTRELLQQLESAGLVQSVKGEGRKVTAKGQGFLDNAAHEVKNSLKESLPALAKY